MVNFINPLISNHLTKTQENHSIHQQNISDSFEEYCNKFFPSISSCIRKLVEYIPPSDEHFSIQWDSLLEEFKQKIDAEDVEDFEDWRKHYMLNGNCQGQTMAFLKNANDQEFINDLKNWKNSTYLHNRGLEDLKKWVNPHLALYAQYLDRNIGGVIEKIVNQEIEINLELQKKYPLAIKKIREGNDFEEADYEEVGAVLAEIWKLNPDLPLSFREKMEIIIEQEKLKEISKILDMTLIAQESIQKDKGVFNFYPLEETLKKEKKEKNAFCINMLNKSKPGSESEWGHAIGIIFQGDQWLIYDTNFGLFFVDNLEFVLGYVQAFLEYFWYDEKIEYDTINLDCYASRDSANNSH